MKKNRCAVHRRTLNLFESLHTESDGEESKLVIMPDSVAAALVGLGLLARGRIFQLFIMFVVVLYDFINAFPESCSVVSHEIGCL